ncbi:hypothetical protein ACFYSF_32265 [Streptomyces canus]|uniref:hypothetical protein n=1 Tax=Streptomyces canus TaxID=58343 RepID=UPI0036A34EEE
MSADGRCCPLSLIVTPDQKADRIQVIAMVEKIRVPRIGPGRQRISPDSLAADKPYSNGTVRDYLRRRSIRHTIPEKSDSQAARLRKGSHGGRPCGFDENRFKKRNTVERAINRLKQSRAVATLRKARLHLPRHRHRGVRGDLAPNVNPYATQQ